MEKITAENIEKSYPNLIDFDLAREKGLGDEKLSEKYFELVNKYKALFEKLLLEELPLQLIDDNMKKSALKFIPIKDEDKDYYQMTTTMPLDYIYARNNFYIEKLSKEDLEALGSFDELNDESRKFIKRTLKDVINPYGDDQMVFYGPENGKYLCDSTDIVIGIRYDEFADTEVSDEKFQERFLAQLKLISQLSTVLEVVGQDNLGTGLKLVQYNEVSIMKKYHQK